MGTKICLEDCIRLAAERGGMCLSTSYKNNKTKMKWRCHEGHTWNATFHNIKINKQWCKRCYSDSMRLGIDFARKIAKENGGRCLSERYVSSKEPLIWECNDGHIWKTSLHVIKDNKSWCPYCAGKMKLSIDFCKEIANKNGGKCLSVEYINVHSKLLWECGDGHRWMAILSNVRDGSWCPKCANIKKSFTIEDAKELAKSKNGKCLSNEYKNSRCKLEWECQYGHIWFAKFDSIKNSETWCPECSVSKSQNEVAKIIQNIFKNCMIKQNYRGFEWLEINGNRQEIDIYVFNKNKKFTVGIEYDGEQHFMPVTFNGISYGEAIKNFNRTKILDKNKNKKVAEHKEELNYFIRIKYDEPICEGYIREKIFAEIIK